MAFGAGRGISERGAGMTAGMVLDIDARGHARTISSVPMIRVTAVTKRFPVRRSWGEMLRSPLRREKTTVLDNVALEVGDGEFFGLLGQNGAGKTTLFRILSTLILPDSGKVTISGLDVVRDAAAIRALVAPVIASERSLYWRLDARENLRLFAVLHRLPTAEVDDAIERVLNVVSLADTQRKMVGTFSSGMRQRLLIARALLSRPRVLLLDEPTRSLDPVSARDFRVFLRETIVREEGCTVILATHDADDVWNLCDRVAVLDRGELLAVDRTSVLRERAGDDICQLWLRHSDLAPHAIVAEREGVAVLRTVETADSGWSEITIQIDGDSERAAQYLAAVIRAGIQVARFGKRSPDLANLMERVVRTRGQLP
jgi:ABC-2 type transport system ATP-binding protein